MANPMYEFKPGGATAKAAGTGVLGVLLLKLSGFVQGMGLVDWSPELWLDFNEILLGLLLFGTHLWKDWRNGRGKDAIPGSTAAVEKVKAITKFCLIGACALSLSGCATHLASHKASTAFPATTESAAYVDKTAMKTADFAFGSRQDNRTAMSSKWNSTGGSMDLNQDVKQEAEAVALQMVKSIEASVARGLAAVDWTAVIKDKIAAGKSVPPPVKVTVE